MNIVKEFKEFAVKGNVIDLAVGVIIGSAFSKIVDSLVKHIIMPPIEVLVRRVSFSELKVPLAEQISMERDGKQVVLPKVDLEYGRFLDTLLHFFIVAWVVFLVVRQINRMKRQPHKLPPTVRECPYCATNISIKAVRCPSCTSKLEHGLSEQGRKELES